MRQAAAVSLMAMVGVTGALWAQTAGSGAGAQTTGTQAGPAQTLSTGQQMQMGGLTRAGQSPVRRLQAGPSTALTVTVAGRSETLSVPQLQAMPQRTVTVHNGHTGADETYTGVAVRDLLAHMGLQLQPMAAGGGTGMHAGAPAGGAAPAQAETATEVGTSAGSAGDPRTLLLRSFLRATGTDFYFVVYSGAELEPAMHVGDVIVATKRNGEGLGNAGQLMLVSTEDKIPARWVRNLTSISLLPVD